jgi:ectoine hydroxylase-related dioxygenase (phytanoyl-CoA dioxygenase family)
MTQPTHAAIDPATVAAFQQDGVVLLKGHFRDWVDPLAAGIEAHMAQPSWRDRSYHPEDSPGRFFQDYLVWDRIPEYRSFIFESPAAAIAGALMQAATVRLFHEHVLVKEPGTTLKTPWHQDMPYYCLDGPKTCSLWVALDPVAQDTCPEYIAGSHRWGVQFRPERFDGTALTEGDMRELLPDIDADRGAYDIRSWEIEPGDAIAFDYSTVHGAPANLHQNRRRRAFSLRLIGEGATYQEKGTHSPPFPDIGLKPGDPFEGEAFPLLWTAA